MPDLGRRSYEFAGDRMSYRLFIPPDLPPDEAVPLVVALHRYTESGAAMAYMRKPWALYSTSSPGPA